MAQIKKTGVTMRIGNGARIPIQNYTFSGNTWDNTIIPLSPPSTPSASACYMPAYIDKPTRPKHRRFKFMGTSKKELQRKLDNAVANTEFYRDQLNQSQRASEDKSYELSKLRDDLREARRGAPEVRVAALAVAKMLKNRADAMNVVEGSDIVKATDAYNEINQLLFALGETTDEENIAAYDIWKRTSDDEYMHPQSEFSSEKYNGSGSLFNGTFSWNKSGVIISKGQQ